MPLINLETLRDTSGPLMGVDPGTKTLGLAISDATRLIASPLETIRRTKFSKNADRLLSLYGGNDIAALIVGLPVNMDGSHGPPRPIRAGFLREPDEATRSAHLPLG